MAGRPVGEGGHFTEEAGQAYFRERSLQLQVVLEMGEKNFTSVQMFALQVDI